MTIHRVYASHKSVQGSRTYNCDFAAIHTYDPKPSIHTDSAVVAMAVVDGVGNSEEIADTARDAARVIARTAAHQANPLTGIMAAHAMMADPTRTQPNAAAVVAVHVPGRRWRIAWIGDCRAYALVDGGLRQVTRDHNIGEMLRSAGVPEEIAAQGDTQLRTGLVDATISTVDEAWVETDLVILTSDGVHDMLSPDQMTDLARQWWQRPERLTGSLAVAVKTARLRKRQKHVDDATVVAAAVGGLAEINFLSHFEPGEEDGLGGPL